MQNLFAASKFKGGELDFSASGNTKVYNGYLNINNTTILEYGILNNILAFVNTIPSLVTFSLPGYNKNGLNVTNAYMSFKMDKSNELNIKDMSLDSKEIKIVGRGKANIKKNNIDMKLNLKTDLGSTLSKIPIVGYIFLGNETISTSLKVSGKLDDPEISTLIAQDIIVAPLNIIKRTLLFPLHIFENDKK